MDNINATYSDRFDQIDAWCDKTDKKLDGIDAWRDKADRRFDRIDKQLDKITAAMVKGFDRIDNALEKKADKTDLNRALDMLDSIIKRQETDQHERLVMGHHLERIERWSHELADKIGHKLIA